MFVRFKKSSKSVHQTVQIVESIRDGKKVRQKVLASLGVVKSPEDIQRMKDLAQNMMKKLEQEKLNLIPMFAEFENEAFKNKANSLEKKYSESNKKEDQVTLKNLEHQKTINDGYKTVVHEIFNELGFEKICQSAQGKLKFNLADTVKLIISQMLSRPSSKLRSFERQNDLGYEDIELHDLYRAMDRIHGLETKFQKTVVDRTCGDHQLIKSKVDCFFMDVTTLYYESVVQDEVRNFGYSKDQKFHSVQILLCLVVNKFGDPLCYGIFPGNAAEVSTIQPMIKKLREDFMVEQVCIVCDRGLTSLGNIEYIGSQGFSVIAACKIKQLSDNLKLNDLSTFTEKKITEEESLFFKRLDHPKYPGCDLIVTWSKRRAEKDLYDRDRLLEKLKIKLSGKKSTKSFKKLVQNQGYKQFLIQNGSGAVDWQINEEEISKASSWDGFHAVTVSKKLELSTEEVLFQYRNLWVIEDTFRLAKSHLEIRPMYHWTKKRIESHILLTYLSLVIERHLEKELITNNTKLTREEIRYAMSKCQQIHFKDKESNRIAVMQSTLPENAQKIFKALNISTKRKTTFI